MKNKILTLLAVVLTLATLMCVTAFTVSAEETAPSVTIAKFNLAFEDNTYLKYAVRFDGISDSAITEDKIGMLYWTDYVGGFVPGTEDYSSKTVGYTDISGVKHYVFEYTNISAKQLTDYIYSVAYIELDGETYYSEPVKYSALEYAYNRLGKTSEGTSNTELKTLLNNMLAYGASAQLYFDYKEDRLATADFYQIEVVGGALEDGFTSGLYTTGDAATLKANKAEEGFTFSGWRNSLGEIVAKENHAVISAFSKNEVYTSDWNNVGAYTFDGDYIYFGEYPQTIKSDDVIITSNIDSRGYYLGSDGEYYAKVTATPYKTGYTFSTGSTITSGTTYYFKVEPIRWRILEAKDGEALILCDSIIANHSFDDSYADYVQSEIRCWLNDQFYCTAFNDLQRTLILTATVENGATSTGYSSPVTGKTTSDKIFLLSYVEAITSAYGFKTNGNRGDLSRSMLTSDYSRATGVLMATSSDCFGMGWWWLRSPSSNSSFEARFFAAAGSYNECDVSTSYVGVVPALRIKL